MEPDAAQARSYTYSLVNVLFGQNQLEESFLSPPLLAPLGVKPLFKQCNYSIAL